MQAKRPVLFVLLVAWVFFWGAAPTLAEDVGQFTRVVNEVDHLIKGQEPVLQAKVPDAVETQDMVLTKEQSMAVVQFVDESTITISPKSKVTIEDYMYDPSKARNKGTIKIFKGVVEAIIPTTDKLKQKDIQIYTTTAIAGIRGTRVVAAVMNDGSIFYVLPPEQVKAEKSKVRIRMYAPDMMPDAPTVQFVSERLSQGMPLRQMVAEALAANHQPCNIIKASILYGIKVEELYGAFDQVCQADPKYKEICTPCIIMKCALEARRALKQVDIGEMQYGILVEDLAPILGEIDPKDLAAIKKLPTTGIEGPIPNYPPTPEQINQAKLPKEAQQIYTSLVNVGAPVGDLRACMGTLGIPLGPEALAYTPESTAPPPAVTGTGLGGGGGGPETPQTTSPFQ